MPPSNPIGSMMLIADIGCLIAAVGGVSVCMMTFSTWLASISKASAVLVAPSHCISTSPAVESTRNTLFVMAKMGKPWSAGGRNGIGAVIHSTDTIQKVPEVGTADTNLRPSASAVSWMIESGVAVVWARRGRMAIARKKDIPRIKIVFFINCKRRLRPS